MKQICLITEATLPLKCHGWVKVPLTKGRQTTSCEHISWEGSNVNGEKQYPDFANQPKPFVVTVVRRFLLFGLAE